MAKWSERKEAWMRVLVLIVTGIVMCAWGYLSYLLIFIHWLVVLFTGKRNKAIAEFIEYWSSNFYIFFRYLSGMTNQRPFPFSSLKVLSKYSKK